MAVNNTVIDRLKQLQQSSKFTTELAFGQKVDVLPLSIKQQKEILKTALDNITSPITFALVTTEIIKTNIVSCVEPLTILDRIPLLVALRINSIGPIYKAGEITIIPALSGNYKFENHLTESNIEIITKLPTLNDDYKVNQECKNAIDSIKGEDQNKLKEFIGELFIYEFLKFIQRVNLQIEGKLESIDFSTLSVAQQLQILESLPVSLINKLSDFISTVRELEKQQTAGTAVQISLDATFFTKE
jgi:uncharacterized protein YegP (UPF0339 family)